MLKLDQVTVEYRLKEGWYKAVDNVSLHVRQHEAFALLGESGSGKTTLARSILGLLPPHRREGAALWAGSKDLFALSPREVRSMLGRDIGLVTQNPYHAFDPVYKIGSQIGEAIAVHQPMSSAAKAARVAQLLDMVELDAKAAALYPHELSGGMLQRAQLAAALCCRPPLLIADEPTSSLDLPVQAQLIALLNRLMQSKKLTLFIITHDLAVAAALADNTAVMRNGKIFHSGGDACA